MRTKPLHKLKVLDLTRLLPGPVATQHLADMGADVIKIEDPIVGDYARNTEAGDWLFWLVNRNKRGLCLDLKQEAGCEVFLELARNADVIVEGFRPGVVDQLGIGYETIRAMNPRIVYCSISGYGQTGPYRDRAGHDLNYCATAGISDQIGIADSAPAIPNIQIGNLLGGSLSAVMGILAAVIDAQRSGQGRYVDVAMSDCTLAHAIFPLIGHLQQGYTPGRGQDLLSGALPCYSIYETADDRYMAVAALEKKFWDLCCQTLSRPDLKEQHLITGDQAKAVRQELALIFKSRDQARWIEIFAAIDCCVGPVLTLDEAMHNEQFKAREMFVSCHLPRHGTTPQLAFPVKFSEFEFAIERQAPQAGEHSHQILTEIGYGPANIARLRDQGVI